MARPESLAAVFESVDTAYYLIIRWAAGEISNAISAGGRQLCDGGQSSRSSPIIYLGGLGNRGTDSPITCKPAGNGEVLRASGVQVIEFRASIIIGSGASRSSDPIAGRTASANGLPEMGGDATQPIAVEDVSNTGRRVGSGGREEPQFEIGGPDQSATATSCASTPGSAAYRAMIPVPSSPLPFKLVAGHVTPVYARIGRKLVEVPAEPDRG
jgi:uncharacterized protein YbjT (DUF2867 family)